MSKTDANATTTTALAALRLGQTVHVHVQAGVRLINTETGGYIEPGVSTPQTVTPTLLRRLHDGDLVLAT